LFTPYRILPIAQRPFAPKHFFGCYAFSLTFTPPQLSFYATKPSAFVVPIHPARPVRSYSNALAASAYRLYLTLVRFASSDPEALLHKSVSKTESPFPPLLS